MARKERLTGWRDGTDADRTPRTGRVARLLPFRGFHFFSNRHRLNANGSDSHQQIDHFFLVVGEAVGVEFRTNRGVFGLLLFVLIENPFERAAVAEFVVPCAGWNAGERGLRVERDLSKFGACGLVGAQDALGARPALAALASGTSVRVSAKGVTAS